MTTIQIEADVSTEQLLHAIEQLPPQEFARFLAQLLTRVRGVPPAAAASTEKNTSGPSEQGIENNPYLAAAGMFVDDTFAAEVEAYINAQRGREREEAARIADA